MSASTHMHYVSPVASGSRTGLSSGGDMDCFPLGLKTRTRQCVEMVSVGSRPHIWAEDTDVWTQSYPGKDRNSLVKVTWM